MKENNFEKQVQKKMDELKIQPGDAVWEKIELRIEKKKHSRRIFLVLFLLAGLLTAGSYFILIRMQKNLPANGNLIKPSLDKTNNRPSSEESVTDQSKINKQKSIIDIGNTIIAEEKSIIKRHRQYRLSKSSKMNRKIVSAEHEFYHGKTEIEKNNSDKELIEKGKDKAESEDIQYDLAKNDDRTKISANEVAIADTLSKPFLKDNIEKTKDTASQKNTIAKTVKSRIKNKWKTGIIMSAGLSNVGDNVLSINNSSLYSPYPTTSGSAPGINSYYPSSSRKGLGLLIGIFEQKNIKSKTTFSFGLNFKFLNSFHKVGNKNDTLGLFSSQNAVNNYKAYYNFIELPVTLKVKMGKGNKLPVFWQGGIVFSELLNTNALQFNYASGYYYKDNSFFNKTQLGLNTALYANLFSKQRNSIMVGPYFYYSISRVSNEGLYNKKHFVFTGLRTEIIFGK